MNICIKRDGLCIRGLLEKVKDQGPLVIMHHGFTSNYHYFDDLAKFLNDHGYSTLRFDFNGHGTSDGKFEDMDVLNEIEDSIAVLKYAMTLDFVTDIYMLGQSQGGVVSSMTTGYYHDKVKALVLMAPAATLKDDALKGELMGENYDPHHIPDTVSCHGLHVGGHYFRIAQLLPIYEVASQFQGPVCLLHGTADIVVDPIASKRYHDVYTNSVFHLIDDENHNFTVYPDKAFDIILDFFKGL